MRKFPDALVVMFFMISLSWLLTYFIPQGRYERVIDPVTHRETVVGGSYHRVAVEYLSVFEALVAIPKGIIGRADLIVFILLCGGCFYVIDRTGALKEGMVYLTGKWHGREEMSLVVVSFLFAAGGALQGLQEEIIGMMAVLLFFAKRLGFNPFVAVSMSYGSATVGGAFSPINPFAVMVAQREAGLPFFSGSGYRIIIMVLAFTVWMYYIIRYANANRIPKDEVAPTVVSVSIRSLIILVLLGLAFVLLIYGMLALGWGFTELAAEFFVLGIVSGLVGRLGLNGTSAAYASGFKEMIFACVILGLANSITLILKQGTVIDSIIHGLFVPMQYLPPSLSAITMIFSHALLHLAVPSYSGQAIMTMPILVPLSDLIGLSRQVCVLAYQYGAGMGDMFVPTNGALMAILAISGISFNKWFSFIWRPTLIILLLGAVAVVVAIGIGYR